MYHIIIKVVLACHIIAGGLSLLVAPIALSLNKFGKRHCQWGQVYVYGMHVVCISAFILGVMKQNWFLFAVGVFSYYFVLSGVRIIKLKGLPNGQKPEWQDWTINIVAAIFNIGMLAKGGIACIQGNNNSADIVMIVFGLIGLQSIISKIKLFRNPPKEKMFWLFAHMNAMIGAYIATMTAFLTQNNRALFIPDVVAWLAPTFFGVIGIMIGNMYFRKKFGR